MAELIHSDKDLFILKHFKDNHVGLSLSGEHTEPGSTPTHTDPFIFPFFLLLHHFSYSTDSQGDQRAAGGI